LTADEAWGVLAGAHTGIFTTLRRDGMPIALPVWFVVVDRTIGLSIPAATKKLARVRHDPRASFLVESGLAWVDLQAVHLTGTVEVVEDFELIERIDDAIATKYGAFRTTRVDLPERTRAHYADRAFLRLHPDERILSWDNRRLT
jgi:general stress protein 26